MNKRIFADLPSNHQVMVRRLAKDYLAKLVQLTRKDNAEAIKVLREAGIELLTPDSEQIDSFKRSAEKKLPDEHTESVFTGIVRSNSRVDHPIP